MDNNTINIFGYVGSFLISINLIPQIFRIIKKKSGKNISWFTLNINVLASVFMLVYGIQSRLYPVIISNSLVLISSIVIIVLKKYYKIRLLSEKPSSNNTLKEDIEMANMLERCTNKN